MGILRLPQDKLQRLMTTLHDWGDRKTCSCRELQSLIGLLNHACLQSDTHWSNVSPTYDGVAFGYRSFHTSSFTSPYSIEQRIPSRPCLVAFAVCSAVEWCWFTTRRSFHFRLRDHFRCLMQVRGAVGLGTAQAGSNTSGTKLNILLTYLSRN